MASVKYGGEREYPLDGSERHEEERLRDYRGGVFAARGPLDMPFLVLTLVILAIGVIMVLSASFARAYYTSGNPTKYFVRQLIFSVSGIGLMLVTSHISVRIFRRFSMLLLMASVALLAMVLVIGSSGGGAKRWIDLGITTFQPSELAKLAVVLAFSQMICSFKERMATFKYGVLPFAAVLGVIVALLVLEPHLSASIIIIALGAIMMFAGGTSLKWFGIGGAAVIGGAYVIITKTEYATKRITAWLDPFADTRGDGYQIVQSLYAIGSGGFLGLGLGQGRQKYLYLPEEHNDFIFSVVCEELGYVGALLIVILFALLITRGFWLAVHARDKYGALVITGLTSLLAIQVFLNIAVVTNLIPCTGISLPFFSYGGTALWLQLIEMGVILSISRDIPLKPKKSKRSDGE